MCNEEMFAQFSPGKTNATLLYSRACARHYQIDTDEENTDDQGRAMSQHVRTFSVFADVPGSVPSIHISTQLPIILLSGDLVPSGLHRHHT